MISAEAGPANHHAEVGSLMSSIGAGRTGAIAEKRGRLRGRRRSGSASRGVGPLVHYLSDMSDRMNGELQPASPAATAAVSVTATNLDGHEEVSPWMRPEFIDAIARRVLELGAGAGADRLSAATGLLTVSEVARRLNVSAQWVYAHQRDLGAIRLGCGPKARLRFDVTAVLETLAGRTGATGSGIGGGDEAPKRGRRRLVSRPLPRPSRVA